jgi:fumarylacetoacetase
MPSPKPWLNIPKDSDFSIHNLPFGIFSTPDKGKRAGMAIGDKVVDLKTAADEGLFEELEFDYSVLESEFLNALIALGKPVTNRVRAMVQEALCDEHSVLVKIEGIMEEISSVKMHLPVSVGDYTDFYSSLEHATNVGKMFRDPENSLLPNWRHLPVGYHGRASSIVVSGTDIRRPNGQTVPDGKNQTEFGPTQRLDFELEMAFVVGKKTEPGESVSVAEAEEYIFGLVLFNDWSARDIQKWEYQPLGPFLGKSFASTISPWIVPLEALEPFRVKGPDQDPEPLEYLRSDGKKNFDINLEVAIRAEGDDKPSTICKTNFRHMYWNMAQQLAHHTSNGCNLNEGDMMASGTISGKDRESQGCMLELTLNGAIPITLNNDQKRSWLEDGDTVILRGFAEKDGVRVGFGECVGRVVEARK